MDKPGLPVSQVRTSAPPPVACALAQSAMNLLPPMGQFGQMQAVMHFALRGIFYPHQSDSSGLATRVQFEGHRLHLTGRVCTIFEPDGERPQPMHDCSFAPEQQTRPFLRARHQRFLPPI